MNIYIYDFLLSYIVNKQIFIFGRKTNTMKKQTTLL